MPMRNNHEPNIKAQAVADGSIELMIFDDIGPDWAGMIGGKTVADALAGQDRNAPLSVHINSVGGDVYEGTAIYNLLSQWAGDVTVIIDGAALSAASLIAMAGDKICMAENAVLMIHEPWTMTWGTSDELVATAGVLDKLTAGLCATYAARTGKSTADIAALLEAETYMTAQEAKDAGFITEIVPAKSNDQIPVSAESLKRFRNMPQRVAAMLRPKQPEPETMAENKTTTETPVSKETVQVDQAAAAAAAATNAEAQTKTQAAAAEAAAPAAKTGKDFIASFGDQGAIWFAEGKTFGEATELHRQALVTENAALSKKLKTLDRGEEKPAQFASAGKAAGGAAADKPKKAPGHQVLADCISIHSRK